jgi:hypothetical protein
MNDELRDLPPSERADKKAEIESKLKGVVEQRQAMLREDFGRTFQTEHGKRVLAYIADRCGWGKPPLAANSQGIIDEKITTHNAMELSLYMHIRKFIHIDVLQQVEYGDKVKPSGTITESAIANAKTGKTPPKNNRKKV